MSPEVFVTVFVGSLLGSLHCVGMCGGFVAFYSGAPDASASTSKLPWAHLAYNGGRLLTYLTLGAVAGSLGAALNLAGSISGVREVAAIVSGAVIALWGLAMLLQATTRFTLPTPSWLNRLLSKVLPRLLNKPPIIRALILGMSSTLLPCAWLYGFVVTAAGTGSALTGALLMGAFWLGTVPAMLGTGLGIKTVARWVGPKLPVLMPAMLIVLGLVTLASRGSMIPSVHSHPAAQEASCHGEH